MMAHPHSHDDHDNIDNHEAEAGCGCGHDHCHTDTSTFRIYLPVGVSLVLLLIGIALDNYIANSFFSGYIRLAWYLAAYLPVGYPVIKEAFEASLKKDFFNEFSLMVIATLGAMCIKEYPEAVAVMLFYTVGELFQGSAVNKARGNIKALLDIRPDAATVMRGNNWQVVAPQEVTIGESIQIKVGEKVPLDGVMLSERSSFNTSALTGESKPKTLRKDDKVLAGMVNLDAVIEIRVDKIYEDSSLAKILDMVQNATSRKAKTELLIRKFAKIYTPIVFFLALAITIIPYLVVSDYIFRDWLYKALVFLVISCPCALVISIPLGYFGGIGAASRHGILFKGANYLDIMAKVNVVVMDKTGTLTQGVFEVQTVVPNNIDASQLISIAAAIESYSTHPIAKAIASYADDRYKELSVRDVEEISGHGLKGYVQDKAVLAGNEKLLQKYDVSYDNSVANVTDTIVLLAIDNKYAGYITIADSPKEDAAIAISKLASMGVTNTIMLSGDKSSITQNLGATLGVKESFGDLLPEDKVSYIEQLKSNDENVIAFVGDGINDAPSLALSDVGIAMGGMGSDAAIEVADVIIQTDEPSRIATAIEIAKATRRIVIQNILLAFGVKAMVLVLGAGGLATMWEAVFADVGVALLAILNAVRILRKKF